jgi:hypothetical protein
VTIHFERSSLFLCLSSSPPSNWGDDTKFSGKTARVVHHHASKMQTYKYLSNIAVLVVLLFLSCTFLRPFPHHLPRLASDFHVSSKHNVQVTTFSFTYHSTTQLKSIWYPNQRRKKNKRPATEVTPKKAPTLLLL